MMQMLVQAFCLLQEMIHKALEINAVSLAQPVDGVSTIRSTPQPIGNLRTTSSVIEIVYLPIVMETITQLRVTD